MWNVPINEIVIVVVWEQIFLKQNTVVNTAKSGTFRTNVHFVKQSSKMLRIVVFHLINNQTIFHSTKTVTASAILENHEVTTILCDLVRAHGPKLRLWNIDDRVTNVHETSASVFYQRSKLQWNLGVSLLFLFSIDFFPIFNQNWFLSIERNIISSSIFSDVAILNVHFGSCWLDDIFRALLTYRHT